MTEDESKFRESIWAIRPKWRLPFYIVLSIWGIVVSVFTLVDQWRQSWLEIFDEIRNGIVSSVVFVWFVFQIGETAVGAYQYFMDLKKARLQEAEEKGRKEAEDRVRKLLEDGLRKNGTAESEILRVLKLIDASEKNVKIDKKDSKRQD